MANIKKQILERLRSRGKPQLVVLRNDLSKTDWSIRLATGAEILPFLTAATAALEEEENDGLLQRANIPTPNLRQGCNTVWPLYDPQANDDMTGSEKKLLDFLKEARVLPRFAGLEQLRQWGQANGLPFRLDLNMEGSQLYSQEITGDLIPGVSVARFVRGTAQRAAQANNQTDLGLDSGQPIKKSEQRLLTHLQQIGILSQGAELADLCRWGRANGLYRRIDIQTAGNALLKSGITITQQEERARAVVQDGKSGRVVKSTARKTKKARCLGTNELLAWLQRGGSIASSTAVSQPDSKTEHLPHATNDMQYTSGQLRDQDVSTTIPGLAERLAERAEFRRMMSEPPRDMYEKLNDCHRSALHTSLDRKVGDPGHVATHSADKDDSRTYMRGELKSHKRRSFIAPDATLQDESDWKQVNVVSGETWYATSRRGVSKQAALKETMDGSPQQMDQGIDQWHIQSSSAVLKRVGESARSTAARPCKKTRCKLRAQLKILKAKSLICAEATIEDLSAWKEANVLVNESWGCTLDRLTSAQAHAKGVPTDPVHFPTTESDAHSKAQTGDFDASEHESQLGWAEEQGFFSPEASTEDMLRWKKTNAKEGERCPEFAAGTLNLPGATKKQITQLKELKTHGVLEEGAMIEDMMRWIEANVQRGLSFKGAIRRKVAENVTSPAGDLEMLAQAGRDHALGVLENESQQGEQSESGSDEEGVEFVLE